MPNDLQRWESTLAPVWVEPKERIATINRVLINIKNGCDAKPTMGTYSVESRLFRGVRPGLHPGEGAFAEHDVERVPRHSARHERRDHRTGQRWWKSVHTTDASTATNHWTDERWKKEKNKRKKKNRQSAVQTGVTDEMDGEILRH